MALIFKQYSDLNQSMKIIDHVVNQNKCTGCGACANICPTGAITMVQNHEGFYVPQIDDKKCIHCGLCDKTCPILNKLSTENQYPIPYVYAGWNKDEKIRMRSSSGGIFSIFADYILDKDGYVCGAAFDEHNKVKHIIISSKKDLSKLRGAKYVQSETGNVFKEIKQLLDKDKWLLFTGTPCQATGLRSFLKKDYEKLLIIDTICHGVPSPLVFDKYLKFLEKKLNQKINKIDFRDKSTGWDSFSFSIKGKYNIHYKELFTKNIFFDGFLNNLFLNSICTSCPYTYFPKLSDLTIGDYWGIQYIYKDIYNNKGVSLIICNNIKGNKILKLIINKLYLRKILGNHVNNTLLTRSVPCDKHVNRNIFFDEFINSEKIVPEIINHNLISNCQKKNSIAIFNMRFPTNNFGAILQSYALSKTINKFGYDVKVINYRKQISETIIDKLSVKNLNEFRINHIPYTLPCYTDEDLTRLNNDFDTFIVGSDQVWNYNYLKWAFPDNIAKYFLNFVSPTKKIISYAASFAEDNWSGNASEIEEVMQALSRFSHISVREKSGVNICKNIFKVDSNHVLDPTFLLDNDEYENIISEENVHTIDKKYILYFSLDNDLESTINTNENLINFSNQNKLKIVNAKGEQINYLGNNFIKYHTISQWLSYIKNSDLVITDSYHGIIFSIIFKRQFIALQRDYAGNERLNSLLSLLKIKDKYLKDLNSININDLYKNRIDYHKIFKILNKEKLNSLNFLEKSIQSKNREISLDKIKTELINNIIYQSKILDYNRILRDENEKLKKTINVLYGSKTYRYSQKLFKLLHLVLGR